MKNLLKVISGAPIVYFELDNDWNYIYVSPQLQERTGYTQDQLLRKNIWEVFPHLKNTAFYPNFLKSKQTNSNLRFLEYYQPLEAWYEVSCFPSKKSLAVYFDDVTERVNKEKHQNFMIQVDEVLSSSIDYRDTLANIAKLIVPELADWFAVDLIDSKGNFELIEVAHKDPEKVRWAKELRKRYPIGGDDKSPIISAYKTGKPLLIQEVSEQILKNTAVYEEQLKLSQDMGFSSVIIVPLIARGKTLGVIELYSTESKRHFKKDDLRLAEELARLAGIAINNASLYKQAQDELKERKRLERQKDNFVGIASHELKTPVTSIKAYVQILHYKLSKKGDIESAKILSKVNSQLDKLTSLISDLLDVTKIEAGKMAFNYERFDFNQLVDEVIENMQLITEHHQIEKKGQIKVDTWADRERVSQVLANLLSNAIKYSPQADRVIVHLSCDGKQIIVGVQDFGIGIEEEKQKQVFRRFFRVSGPDRETYPGLGLGLYISSEIVKRQGGKIWVESKENMGSTFFFSIPIKTTEKDDFVFSAADNQG